MLTYAGRLILIKAILFRLQIYWSLLFILPSEVLKEIASKLRAFFWAGVDLNYHKAKVAWEDICVPKEKREVWESWLVKSGTKWR